jgi:hypothetical protein
MADRLTGSDPDAATANDRLVIRELLDSWIIWRDGGEWERFATVWHDDGRMVATWCQASAAEYIENCRKRFDAGFFPMHIVGGAHIDVSRNRAVAQSKMQIVMRGKLDGVAVRSFVVGRYFDALEKRSGRWGFVLRQPVYDIDWLSPMDPADKITLDQKLLSAFPQEYCHSAYLQTRSGLDVARNMPTTNNEAMAALRGRMAQWLQGAAASCLNAI